MGPPGGYHVSMEIKGEGMLEFDIAHKLLLTEAFGLEYRWVGTLNGGFGNGTMWTGQALYEQFTF